MNRQALLDALVPTFVSWAELQAYTDLAGLAARWRLRAQVRRASRRMVQQYAYGKVHSFTYNGPGAECIGRLIRAVAGGRTD